MTLTNDKTSAVLLSSRGTVGLDGSVNATRKRDALLRRFENRIAVNYDLTRSLVSWQSNKQTPGFRWFRYKEGFSSKLVHYLLNFLGNSGHLLDPFSGTGTAPIIASSRGWEGIGIEILPVGVKIANGWLAASVVEKRAFWEQAQELLKAVEATDGLDISSRNYFPHVRITEKAFTDTNEYAIAATRYRLCQAESGPQTELLALAAMAALEDASWTRKDGQYLRWDHRSGRKLKARMEKRQVLTYAESLRRKLGIIAADLPIIKDAYKPDAVRIVEESCYDALPCLPDHSVDAIITSPPYANRYDYTRTYALELAWLGYDNKGIGELRQRLLSATVENLSKRNELAAKHADALELFDKQAVVAEITDALEIAKARRELSNPHVIRLVHNYFLEMTAVIVELARVCKSGASVFMVNDNVQYHGEEVPVDLILSDIAEQCGFETKVIWTLPRGKGNASQQMGRFGRRELRKCVYWWIRQ
jgi:DNA modification methylase